MPIADRYDLEREVGRGGMAIVYLAHDRRHDRHVAIKVLHADLTAALGPDRFLQEIRVTATLQHPHILGLIDSGLIGDDVPELAGRPFYVMPFVDGESLRQRLDRERPLPVAEAVRLATEIAGALDYAHRRGVVHRDVKPENILIHDGQALVADFGIALAASTAGTARMTQTGLSLGTPQYMSPEQAMGEKTITARSDIYAMGAVTYEMLVGEPPFTGPTLQAVIARVVTEEPRPVAEQRRSVPPHVAEAVHRALAKVPADRWQTAHDFAHALGDAHAFESRPVVVHAARERVPAGPVAALRRSLPWVVASAAVAGMVWQQIGRTASAETEPIRFELTTPEGVAFFPTASPTFVVSPDGRTVAFVGSLGGAQGGAANRRVYVRTLGDLAARPLAGTEGAIQPFFSTDGKWIGFMTPGQTELRKVQLDGGSPVAIARIAIAQGFAWTGSGAIVTSVGGRLMRVPATGGTLQEVAALDSASGETRELWPHALADGENVLYGSFRAGGVGAMRIGIVSLRDGSKTVLDLPGTYPIGVIDGLLVYASAASTIMAVPFDAGKRRVTGSPFPVVEKVSLATNGLARAELSRSGTLIYQRSDPGTELVEIGAGGHITTLVSEVRDYSWPRYSPDGKRIALTINTPSRSDVWIYDLPSGPMRRLTTEGTLNDRPEWTPDGRRVLFRSNRGARNALYVQPWDNSGPAEPYFARPGSDVDEGIVSRDARWLVFQRDTTGTGDVWFRGLAGDTAAKPVESTAFAEHSPRPSPDGKWVAYVSDESGTSQVYVKPLPSMASKHQVSIDGGTTPVWSVDGKRIVYASGTAFVAADVSTNSEFRVQSRTQALSGPFAFTYARGHANFDVSPLGNRILALRTKGPPAQILVIHNFRKELTDRLREQRRR